MKALDLESYEAVDGKHFLQEDSSGAIADEIARLISASGGHRSRPVRNIHGETGNS